MHRGYTAERFLGKLEMMRATVKDLAASTDVIVGFPGEIRYDADQPDGTPRKLLDVSRLANRGWQPDFSLRAGLKNTYDCYRERLGSP